MIKRQVSHVAVSRVLAATSRTVFHAACSVLSAAVIGTVLLISAGDSHATVLAQDSIVPEFSATLEQRFAATDQLINRAAVFVGAQGYRVEQLMGLTDQVLITDTLNKYLWFVDKGRSLAHKVPFSVVKGASLLSDGLVLLPGSITSVPCLGLQGERAGDKHHNGRTLQVWNCIQPASESVGNGQNQELPALQYYSPALKLVLYSRSQNGFETDVVDVVRQSVDDSLMAPPAHFKSISYDQFMHWRHGLEPYQPES